MFEGKLVNQGGAQIESHREAQREAQIDLYELTGSLFKN